MHFVYVVYNHNHDKMYIGETDDLDERVKAHNDHRFSKSYTSRFDGEWKVIYSEKCENRVVARKREKQLKSYRGREYVKKFIPG